ncbi:hypothetical protein BDB01DRAFT_836734 [Pilobolus umbonatus]|nr:hypothetical protein BDB01DRAFT_836734 [Pilobolus umbonatus]
MGKQKQPRVKGNMKPASSSRAADMLGSGNALSLDNLGGFAQFVAPNQPATSLLHSSSRPSTPSSDRGDSPANTSVELDPEIIVILKKLSKRDTITKLKALEELEVYLNSNISVISHILSKWISLFGKLILDVDRRVRLASAQVHYIIVTNAKKKLAPMLKDFIGPWLLAMFDPSKDTARMARSSFETTFAEDKRTGVLSFCQKEVLDYVCDILLYKSSETLSDARYVSPEDMKSKYSRVISGSLQVICYFIDNLSVSERSKYQTTYDSLFSDIAVWKKFFQNDSPVIRKSMYNLIKTLILKWDDIVCTRLDIICPSFFTCIFNEKDPSTHSEMWDALLLMTKNHPLSWIIIGKKKPATSKLYNFLRCGLNGSPTIAYPSLIALLANLPAELRNTPKFYFDLFDNFWKGFNSGHIDRNNSPLFMKSYMECIVYFAVNESKDSNDKNKLIAKDLIQITLWNTLRTYFLRNADESINEKMDANNHSIIAKHLMSLGSLDCTKDYTMSVWANMYHLLVQTVVDCNLNHMDLFCKKVADFLVYISTEMHEDNVKYSGIHSEIQALVNRLIMVSIESAIVHKELSPQLITLANSLVTAYNISSEITDMYTTTIRSLMDIVLEGNDDTILPLITLYVNSISHIKKKESIDCLWDALIGSVTRLNTIQQQIRGASVLIILLENIKTKKGVDVSSVLKQWEALITLYVFSNTLDDSVVRRIIYLTVSIHLESNVFSQTLVELLLKKIHTPIKEFGKYNHMDATSPTLEELDKISSTFKILLKLFDEPHGVRTICNIMNHFTIDIFDLLSMNIHKSEQDYGVNAIIDSFSASVALIWSKIVPTITDFNPIVKHIKCSILDINYSLSPADFASKVKNLLSELSDKQCQQFILSTLLGTENEWKTIFSPFSTNTIHYLSLSIVDRYSAISTVFLVDDKSELMPIAYDMYGLSSFSRFILFWGELLIDSHVRSILFHNENIDWVMIRLMMGSILYEQESALPDLCRSWDKKAVDGIRAFISNIHIIFSDWFSTTFLSTLQVDKFASQFHHLVGRQAHQPSDDRIISLLSHLIFADQDGIEAAIASNLLQTILQKLLLLSDWKYEQVEKWLMFLKADSTELALMIKVAILVSIKDYVGGSVAYNHYQSDLASKLSALKKLEQLDYSDSPSSAKNRNWDMIVLLNESSLKYGAIDIPRQRLTHLIQSLRPILLDDQFSGSRQQRVRIQIQLAQLLNNLSVSMQEVPGTHWQLFLQCSYQWIKYNDSDEPEELPILYYSFALFSTLSTLSKDNEDIQNALHELSPSINTRLLELLMDEEEVARDSLPDMARMKYQALLSDLLEDVPDTISQPLEEYTKLYKIMQLPNDIIQRRSYLLLKTCIHKHVHALSVDLEFTSTNMDENRTVFIDQSILDSILHPPQLMDWEYSEYDDHIDPDILGYLLAWMLLFDHFTDITFKLKQEYTLQLKEKEAISHLMPFLFKVLGLGNQQSKSFDLSPWAYEEYEMDSFDPSMNMSYILLASHVYYRALTHIPSLVRLWWIECKQRQFTLAVESFTEKFYSQLLINNEMELINRPDVKSSLEETDGNEFTVKTLKAASEVTATYVVDEQNMQIAIKLPSNYPLKQIDVEGVQKVGVTDKQWRGWMFAIVAVIGSQNGNIVDALTVFKHNANLHFNGVEDCTICYSIISIQDRSIPNKQCRTCKNKFHSSCLYKWFRSSNSASCPLCRTVF